MIYVKSRVIPMEIMLLRINSLVLHGLTVESVMRNFARKNYADEKYWAMVGLTRRILIMNFS